MEGLRWVFKALVGIRGLRWVQMGWDGCRGGPGTDPDGLGWYGMSGMGLEQWFLNWVRSNPWGSVSQFQGFGGLVHPTCRIHHITLCLAIIEYLDEIIELHQRQVQQKLFKTIIFST